ncbi:PREDICTED: monocarboxylate transporter 4 [Rhagoletis zephyria]|uniref:monocarboxylate transporter 4 n=1 Tax=Rhagoletis zephyria TaxID=28612 RepID=UPI0008116F7F|nr:PREDICTED: monocarboxylate transporter 4 [Rhagoletis zephyria]XP_036338275.1 monocarboxylate transporter 4 [Rhagoletis pomonella]XP_036338276.1 monocarboxylate transporter 4 [Rhagoletis pomonella]XP_036338277.1 monocarboxylate transporter 4 [Rhagoletis pomonella]
MGDTNTLGSGTRLRKFDRTDSEVACEEAARLTADLQEGAVSPDDEDDLSEYGELPPPPDGGYGWVICFASFMCNMIVDGIAYTFGIFLGEFVNYFGEGKGKVAWVGSLLSGVYLSAGPIVSALANKFGCRAVCIAGSVVGCIAFVLSTMSTSINMLMVTYGVIGGFGFGMIYLPAVVAVGYYFETKRSLATGIAVCGSGFGTFAFAPLATYLLQLYGWKNALLIFAGLILNCAIFGAMMRPLTYPKKKKVKPLMQRMYEEKQLQLERGSIAGSHFMVQLPDGSMERKMKMPLNADPGVHSSLNLELLAQQGTLHPVSTLPTITEAKVAEYQTGAQSPPTVDSNGQLDVKRSGKRSHRNSETETSPYNSSDAMTRNASQPAFMADHQSLPKNGSVPSFNRVRKTSASERFQPSLAAIRASSRGDLDSNGVEMGFTSSKMSLSQRQDSGKMVRPMSRKDIFYSGSVTNLPQYQSQKSLTNYRNSVLSLTKYEKSMQSVRVLDPLAEAEKGRDQYDLCPCLSIPDSIKSVFNTMLDVSLLKDPVFMLIGISNVFGMAGLYVPFVYLVDAAKKDGIEDSSASFLLSIIGITNTFGRVICGYVADFPSVDSLLLNNVCLLVSTVAVSLTPLCSSYGAYVTMSIFFGAAISGYISLTSIILVDLLGLDKLTNAFGLLILFRGFAAIIGSPLAGAVYDATQSYDLPFYMAGGLFALSTITSFMAPCLKRWTTSDEAPMQIDTLEPIDEEQGEEVEDEEDQPITIVPKIVKTLPSPQREEAEREFSGETNKTGAESKL